MAQAWVDKYMKKEESSMETEDRRNLEEERNQMVENWVKQQNIAGERDEHNIKVEKVERGDQRNLEEERNRMVENWVKQQNIAGERDEHNINVQMQVNATGGNCCLHLVLPPVTQMEVDNTKDNALPPVDSQMEIDNSGSMVEAGKTPVLHSRYEPVAEDITPPCSPSNDGMPSGLSEMEETGEGMTPLNALTLAKAEEQPSQVTGLCQPRPTYHPSTPIYTCEEEEDMTDKAVSNVPNRNLVEKVNRALDIAQFGVSSTKLEFDRRIERLSDAIVGLEVMLGDIRENIKALQENIAGEMLNLESAKTDELTNKCKIIGDLVWIKQELLDI